MQERQRRLLVEHVVVVGGAAHERGEPRHGVADLEAEALGEQLLRGLLVGRAEHHVSQLARLNPVLAQHARRAGVGPGDVAGALYGGDGVSSCSIRSAISTTTVTSVPGS